MNKKGQETKPMPLSMKIVIGLLVLFMLMGWSATKLLAGEPVFSSTLLDSKNQQCKTEYDRLSSAARVAYDTDKDGCHDSYDVCIIGTQTNNFDDLHDTDADGIPNACDEEPDNAKVVACANPHKEQKDLKLNKKESKARKLCIYGKG